MATSILLSTVLITDLEYLGTSGWAKCRAQKLPLDPEIETTTSLEWDDGNGHAIPLITNMTPQEPRPKEVGDINFNRFKIDSINDQEDYTLFHSYGVGGLGNYENRKTTMIRYKTVCVIVESGTSFPTKSSDWSYAMIRTSFDVENTLIDGFPENSYSSSFEAMLHFRFPGFTPSQLGTTAFNSLISILNDTTNWEIILTKQGSGTSTKHAPTSLAIDKATEAGPYTGFGVAFIPITLRVTFTGVSSGTYTLSALFKKNDTGDVESYLPIPAEYTVTVQLAIGTAIPTEQVFITDDGAVQISVVIQTDSGLSGS